MVNQPPDDHAERVRASFDDLHAKVGPRLDDEARAAVERVKTAAAARDAGALRTHVGQLKEHHGWLYKELATHPQIANLLDELALIGL